MYNKCAYSEKKKKKRISQEKQKVFIKLFSLSFDENISNCNKYIG